MADWLTDLLENLGYNLPSEQDAREDALRPQEEIARETYPELDLQDTPTDLTTLGGNSILKEIVCIGNGFCFLRLSIEGFAL